MIPLIKRRKLTSNTYSLSLINQSISHLTHISKVIIFEPKGACLVPEQSVSFAETWKEISARLGVIMNEVSARPKRPGTR